MKKRKIKLFASLTSLVMVVAVMAVGIWAATSVTTTISNKVSFTATDHVRATIDYTAFELAANTGLKTEGEGSGAAAPLAEALTPVDVTIDASSEETSAIDIGNFVLTATDEDQNIGYSYTIVITNTAKTTDYFDKLLVRLDGDAMTSTATLAANGYAISVTNNGVVADTEQFTIQRTTNNSATIVVTFVGSPSATFADISAGFTITLDMEHTV